MNARIQPLHRGDRYDDPLMDALESGVIANVAGGGSQLMAGGNEIDLPNSVYAECDVNHIISEIDRLLAGVGSYQSYRQGPTETGLYVYGASRDDMRELLADLLDTYPS